MWKSALILMSALEFGIGQETNAAGALASLPEPPALGVSADSEALSG